MKVVSMIINLSKENYEETTTLSTKPVVIDVYASWCGPCKYMMPIIEEIAREHSSKYVFAKLNVDEQRELAIKLGVTAIPTFVFMKPGGSIQGRETGSMSKEDFVNTMEKLLR